MTTKQNRRIERAKARERQRFVQKWVIGTLLVLAIAVGVILMTNARTSTSEEPSLYKNQPMLGDEKASVKIVEFGDFKCPACARFTQEEFVQIKKDFIDTNQASFHFVNYQIIPNSMRAAIASESVFKQNPAEFWDYYKAIYTAQQKEDESKDWATTDKLVQIAKDAKIDVDFDQLKKDIEDKKYEENVLNDNKLARQLKITGTPALVVNGKYIKYNNYEDIKRAIEFAKAEVSGQ